MDICFRHPKEQTTELNISIYRAPGGVKKHLNMFWQVTLALLVVTIWNISSMVTRPPGRDEDTGMGSRVFRDLVTIILIINIIKDITDLILLHKIEI